MTIRNLAVARFVFVALTIAAIALIPMTSAVAARTVGRLQRSVTCTRDCRALSPRP